jgi:hypothetical protein
MVIHKRLLYLYRQLSLDKKIREFTSCIISFFLSMSRSQHINCTYSNTITNRHRPFIAPCGKSRIKNTCKGFIGLVINCQHTACQEMKIIIIFEIDGKTNITKLVFMSFRFKQKKLYRKKIISQWMHIHVWQGCTL